jgi:murein DD-endopeptidase MepM/ murein hydrolase activator NlpD
LETIGEIITQPFTAPRQLDDGTYKDDAHHGLDLGYYTRDGELFTGTPVLSAANGRVAALIFDRPPYGNAILVETPFEQIPVHLVSAEKIPAGSSLYILYAHLQNLQTFSLQQKITCGEPLAETGLTGFTGGPHLHFETRWGPAGQTFDSMAYYHVETTEAERANYVLWRMSGTFRLFDPMILLSPPSEN